MKVFKFCRQYLMSQKMNLIFYIFLTLLASTISIITPFFTGKYIDKLVVGASYRNILMFCVFFSSVSILKIFKDYASSILYTKMQVKMGYCLNAIVLKHIQALSLSFINHKDGMYLNQRINGDSYALISFCLTTLKNILLNVILFIVPIFILISLNSIVTIILIFFILLYVIVYLSLRKKLYTTGHIYRESVALFFAKLFEQLKFIKLIKINSVQKEFNERLDKTFRKHMSISITSQKLNFIYKSLDNIISSIAQIFLFVIGAIQVIKGNFTIGMFTVFSSYFHMMINSSRYFFGLAASYQGVLVSYNRIQEILNFREEKNGEIVIENVNSIQLNNVCFSYNNINKFISNGKNIQHKSNQKHSKNIIKCKEEVIINDFNYEFIKGKMYGLVGSNGSGKSTITNLIIGLYVDEISGEIKYNNIPISDIDMINARKQIIGYADQEPVLINDSIYYNLSYNKDSDCSYDERLEYYVNILDMGYFIDKKSITFEINEKNNNISGGEKQKIAILKVLYKDPQIMIFDEPTSALDKKTTQNFIDYLNIIKHNKIIIIVTHDDNIKAYCDEVINFEQKIKLNY